MELGAATRFFRRLGRSEAAREELVTVTALLERGARPSLDSGRFAEHVASHCTKVEDLAALCIEDLALAFACAEGHPDAIAELERIGIEPVPKSLARLKADAGLIDEVRQALRHSLLVGPEGGRPKILGYKGAGPLAAWVRVVAVRMAYDLVREGAHKMRDKDLDAFETLADDADAPDVVHLKTRYAQEVKNAFREAAESLAPEERAVLRAHAVDGLTIDQIGALYQVHRATAARWVQHAKAVLLAALRDALARRLGLERDACDSLVALVRSRIDLSLERAFAPDE